MRRLSSAKGRLDLLGYYPGPVSLDGVRIRVWPWLFRLPGFRGYVGYAFWRTIVVARHDHDLLTHELCHIWQVQQAGRLRTTWAYLRHAYLDNPYEQEARRAVRETAP